ncbi:MAG: GerMN domain-containing protein [Clostridiales bacterium]|jgi:germination protein M|nr:GerMN domain-containing protein [Clostridiales bacterium]
MIGAKGRIPEKPRDLRAKIMIWLGSALAAAAVCFIAAARCSDGGGAFSATVYYVDKAGNTLSPIERVITAASRSREDVVGGVVAAFRDAPQGGALSSALPADVSVRVRIYGDSNAADVSFGDEYHSLSPVDELFLRAGIVMTLTGLDFIDGVTISVGGKPLKRVSGEPLGELTRNSVSADATIPVSTNVNKVFTVYFADKDGEGLLPESRIISVDRKVPSEEYVIQALIDGPADTGMYRTLPQSVHLLDAKTEDGTCYVDLSFDFITGLTGGISAAERLAVYSIVNSLTELSGVKDVQILVEGNKVETISGGISLSSPLPRNEAMILEAGS